MKTIFVKFVEQIEVLEKNENKFEDIYILKYFLKSVICFVKNSQTLVIKENLMSLLHKFLYCNTVLFLYRVAIQYCIVIQFFLSEPRDIPEFLYYSTGIPGSPTENLSSLYSEVF